MPEGDTIHYHASRIRPVLEGHVPDALETPHPRFGRDRWPERLQGQAVRSVDAHGKNLFLRFDNAMTVHSHLRMSGRWRIFEQGFDQGPATERTIEITPGARETSDLKSCECGMLASCCFPPKRWSSTRPR